MSRPEAPAPRVRLDLLDPVDVARLGGLELVSEGIVEGFLSGLHRSPRRGFSVEFAEHRMYQPGDELRYVDWKMLGRSDRLYVKQYEEETNLRAMIVCDASKSMAWSGSPGVVLPKLAYAQRLIASLSLVLLRQRDATGLIVFDDEVRARHAAARAGRPLAPAAHHAGRHQARPGHRRGAGPQARRGHPSPPRARRVRVRPPARSRARAHRAAVPPPSRAPGGGAAPHGSRARSPSPVPPRRASRIPETGTSVVLRPRDWAEAYDKTVKGAVSGWNAGVPAERHQVPSDRDRHAVRTCVAGRARELAGMTFLHPWLLAGLLAAGVPLLLHLVQRREPPTVVFPAVRYLLDATREHQRRLRIRHWLLLLLRTLLIVALVLAAAGPDRAPLRRHRACAQRARARASTTA